jgi:hypothetical protein
MSDFSRVFASYQNALTGSRDKYTQLYTERAENGKCFYDQFFQDLVVAFKPAFDNTAYRAQIVRQIERFFGTNLIDFVAIDGTCQKDAFNDFVVFFGGAYGAKGRVALEGDPPKVKYQKWELNKDVSLVAWVPVPFAELADISGGEETFISSDADRVNLSGIHNSLMQLAEIYLACNVATGSSIDVPRLIMLDQSLSGLMAASSHGTDTSLTGYPYDRRKLDSADVTVAFAHPFNSEMEIPSVKRFRRYTAVLAVFHERNVTSLPLGELEKALSLKREELREPVKFLIDQGLCTYDKATEEVKTTINVAESWAYTVSLFQNICTRLFMNKDQSALTYETTEEDKRKRRRWMSPDDIQFLIAVGLRVLVEACWKKKIMLVGIVKDSESRYLTRNYLGVARHLKLYPKLNEIDKIGLLPWTDRIYLETIPSYCDDHLAAPWASIEFDSTFMTLHLGDNAAGVPEVMGVRTRGGEILAPERLFVRSLAQFYLSRSKRTPLMGHVVFLDRLAFPQWDGGARGKLLLDSGRMGKVEPLFYGDASVDNVGQTIMMYLLATLTKNLFPEVIGYPDPLHKADWGAKSIGRRVRGMIQSSEIPFRSKPVAKTLRSIRDSRGR